MTHLRFEIEVDGRTSLVSVKGEVDAATAGDLLATIKLVHECAGGDVTLDLAGVAFVDSRGLATLVVAQRHLVEAGCRLRIRGAQPAVVRLLHATGVAEHLADPDGAFDG